MDSTPLTGHTESAVRTELPREQESARALGAAESIGDKWNREWHAVGAAAHKSLEEIEEHPVLSFVETAGGMLAGRLLAVAERRAGIVSLGAKLLGIDMTFSALTSGFNSLRNTSIAARNLWNSPENAGANTELLADSLGGALSTVALLTTGGAFGMAYGRASIPRIDHPTLPLRGSNIIVRDLEPRDLKQISELGRVLHPVFSQITPGFGRMLANADASWVLEYPGRGVVGLMNMDLGSRSFEYLGVLPEYRKYSPHLLAVGLQYMSGRGGTWYAVCREGTSYRLLKALNGRGLEISSDRYFAHEFGIVGTPVHRVNFSITKNPSEISYPLIGRLIG